MQQDTPHGLHPAGYSRMPKVRELVGGVDTSTIWRWVRNDCFPRPFRLGRNCVAWRNADVLAWLESRPVADDVTDLTEYQKRSGKRKTAGGAS